MSARTRLAFVLVLAIVGGVSSASAQPLPPMGLVSLDGDGNVLSPQQRREMRSRGEWPACSITTPADPRLDTTDSAALAQAGKDVVAVADALKAALEKSPDMRRKVLEACQRNGRAGSDDDSPWPSIPIFVHRDHPRVDYATANPASGSSTGNVVLDLGDIEQVRNFFEEGSDAELVEVISKSSLTRALAHEFDHLRDGPERGRWGTTHGDPLRHRDLTGKPVDDANQVKEEVGSGDVRTAYGAELIPYSGGTKMPGKVAVLRYWDLVNRNRTATKGGGSGFGSPERIEGVPDRPCDGAGGPCFRPVAGDRDLDGIPDADDNCPETANPWQLDADGDGVGDDCQPAPAAREGAVTPVDVLRGPQTLPPGPPPVLSRPKLKLEAGIGYHTYSQLEEQACAGADSCTTDESGFAPFVQAELRPWAGRSFAFGAGFDRVSGLTTMQTVGGATNEVDLDISSLRVTAGWDAWSSESALVTLWVGIVQAWNEAVVRSVFGGEDLREDRSESGIRVLGGGSLEYRLADRVWGVAGYDYATGGGDDADARHAVRLGIGYEIGRRYE